MRAKFKTALKYGTLTFVILFATVLTIAHFTYSGEHDVRVPVWSKHTTWGASNAATATVKEYRQLLVLHFFGATLSI